MDEGLQKFKLGILGEAGTGKTSLLKQWGFGEFSDEESLTLPGGDYVAKNIEIGSDKIRVLFYDTAGEMDRRSSVF